MVTQLRHARNRLWRVQPPAAAAMESSEVLQKLLTPAVMVRIRAEFLSSSVSREGTWPCRAGCSTPVMISRVTVAADTVAEWRPRVTLAPCLYFRPLEARVRGGHASLCDGTCRRFP